MKQWMKLFEADEPAAQPDKPKTSPSGETSGVIPAENKEEYLKSILKKDYPTFMELLGQNIDDPKFLQAVKSLADKDRVDMVQMNVPVKNLRPTQNEIDITKSLSFPLTDASSMEANLSGGPVAPGGNAIVTSGGGRYIIDGHHRWSQVLVCNPNCVIKAIDMSDIKGPFNALKSTQLGIAAAIGEIPKEKADPGTNLLILDQQSVVNYVAQKIIPEVLDVMRKYDIVKSTKEDQAKIEAGNYIWKNVALMQKNNQPVDGAPNRSIMPQTGYAPKWATDAPNPEAVVEEEFARLLELIKTTR